MLAGRHSKSQEFFASSAGQWDRLRTELFGARPELFALLGLLDPSSTVADLGCGTGQFAEAIAPFVKRVEQLVHAGRSAVAFSLFPVSVADLMDVSDTNAIMPPKSTWFEPKLRDGLLVHVI